MITKRELQDYANLRKIRNLGHAEKDYFQNILLFIISQNYGKKLVFKGGTALNKCFGLDRFSEDLDFTCEEKINVSHIGEMLKRFRVEFKIEKKEYKNSLKIILKIKGPLYIGVKGSFCKLIIDLSFREKIIHQPVIKTIGRFIEEMPIFDILVMEEREILAEKIRACMTRKVARDVYDIWFLIKKEIAFDKSLTNEKLKYFKKSWNLKDFIKSINEKKNIWETELTPLVPTLPKFKEVKQEILKKIPER